MASKKSSKSSFSLTAEEVKQYAAEYKTTKRLPNPFRANGSYHFIVSSLINMGIDEPHKMEDVYTRYAREAGREWMKEWENKKPVNKKTHKDGFGRFVVNVGVCGQRVKDYAKPLVEMGQKVLKTKGVVMDVTRDAKGQLWVTLNTNSATPLKPGRGNKTDALKQAVKIVKADGRLAPAKPKPQPKKAEKKGGKVRLEGGILQRFEDSLPSKDKSSQPILSGRDALAALREKPFYSKK